LKELFGPNKQDEAELRKRGLLPPLPEDDEDPNSGNKEGDLKNGADDKGGKGGKEGEKEKKAKDEPATEELPEIKVCKFVIFATLSSTHT
jgi:hypothetical protein